MLYSYSRLSLYETCPYRFYQKYILGKDEPVTKPLALGKAVHKAIELKINGVSEHEAIIEAIIESDFHPEVTYEEIASLMQRAQKSVDKRKFILYFRLEEVFNSKGISIYWKKSDFGIGNQIGDRTEQMIQGSLLCTLGRLCK